ncbi:MAG: homoaconitate hydratase [Acidobacteriia bacterium]|nr:homoaconitate hydratase [Terriglobia bacterium]
MPRIWKFGDDIDTDQVVPGRYAPYMTGDPELQKYAFIENRPDFAKQVKTGDWIVAGKNFGCGSSREYAAQALRKSPIAGIIAKSYARIFFRNALNLGIPLYESDELNDRVQDGQELSFDAEHSSLTVDGKTYALKPMPGFVHQIIREGSIIDFVKKHGKFPGE